MNLLQTYSNMMWTWKGKQIKLEDLAFNQLNHIKTFVRKYKSNHYGYSSEGWTKAIDYIIEQRNYNNVQELNKIIGLRRKQKINRVVNNFFNVKDTKENCVFNY
jgi:hypothetical protein